MVESANLLFRAKIGESYKEIIALIVIFWKHEISRFNRQHVYKEKRVDLITQRNELKKTNDDKAN